MQIEQYARICFRQEGAQPKRQVFNQALRESMITYFRSASNSKALISYTLLNFCLYLYQYNLSID